jgi:large subunit ribosomal protein L4
VAETLQAPLFASDGTPRGSVDLAPEMFGIEPNVPVMHQVVTAQLAAARAGTHSTLTRSEVRGGGRKPWRQKGMGRARHGSIRSPQWVGGGVAHGPKPRDYSQRTPKKMKRLALRSALSARAGAGMVKVIDRFDWETPRTKDAVALLTAVELDAKVLLVVARGDDVAVRSFRNLPRVKINEVGQLNTYDVLWAEAVLFTSETLAALSGTAPATANTGDETGEDAAGDEDDAAPEAVAGEEDEA